VFPLLQNPCVVPTTFTQPQLLFGEQAYVEKSAALSQVKKFEHWPVGMALAVTLVVVVVVVLVISVTEMTSVTRTVSVIFTVTTGGVIVLLALADGVATVVLRTVSVLVMEVVTGVCKQEHTREMSEAGRDNILEKILA
jgi:hypothetical protein